MYILSGFDRLLLKNIGCSLFFFNALTYGYHWKKVILFVMQNNVVKSIDNIDL